MKKKLIIILLFIPFISFSQNKWSSSKYNYSLDIPSDFTDTPKIGKNVDFKVTKGLSSIVIVVKSLPKELSDFSFLELLGDLDDYKIVWEEGAKEFLDTPKFLKYGKTTLSSIETFWFDYSTENPKLYSKNYQTKKGNTLYTITLTCPTELYNYYLPNMF